MPTPTFLSMFCGCGGLDLGFVQGGFRCLGAYDIDPIAIATHRKNLDGVALQHDFSDGFPFTKAQGKVNVLLAGPPCQGFSTIGKRHVNDPRNAMLVLPARAARLMQPDIVIVENVPGVLAGEQRRYWEQLKAVLRAAGYRSKELRIDAAHFGLAQLRRRLILIAWLKGPEFPDVLGQPRRSTVRDAIAKIGSAPNHDVQRLDRNSTSYKIAKYIRPGQKLSNVRSGLRYVPTWNLPEVYGVTTIHERQVLEALRSLRRRDRIRVTGDADPVSGAALARFLGRPCTADLLSLITKNFVRRAAGKYDLTHTFNGKYFRLAWDGLAPAVDTKFGQARFVLHPSQTRGLTVREAARLQGFPDSFEFDGPLGSQYRLVGNAVPPPIGAKLADLSRQWLRSR